MEITNSMKEISNKSFDYEVNAGMRFKGKVDLWFWIAMIIGDGILISAILSEPDSIACLVGLIVYNMAFLPFVLRNYVDVSDEHVTIVFGFIKQSISLSELTEVRRTKNPISSTAASLDRIILKGNHKSMMCAVRDRDDFLDLLKRKNPAVQIYSKRQKTENSWLEKGVLIFCLLTAVIVVILLFTGNITYEYGDRAFSIKASYWADKEIAYEDITQISYTDKNVDGKRVGGFGSFRLQMWNFKNEEYGRYKRYTYTQCDAAVILSTGEDIFVLSGENQEETQALYRKLADEIDVGDSAFQ